MVKEKEAIRRTKRRAWTTLQRTNLRAFNKNRSERYNRQPRQTNTPTFPPGGTRENVHVEYGTRWWSSVINKENRRILIWLA